MGRWNSIIQQAGGGGNRKLRHQELCYIDTRHDSHTLSPNGVATFEHSFLNGKSRIPTPAEPSRRVPRTPGAFSDNPSIPDEAGRSSVQQVPTTEVDDIMHYLRGPRLVQYENSDEEEESSRLFRKRE